MINIFVSAINCIVFIFLGRHNILMGLFLFFGGSISAYHFLMFEKCFCLVVLIYHFCCCTFLNFYGCIYLFIWCIFWGGGVCVHVFSLGPCFLGWVEEEEEEEGRLCF